MLEILLFCENKVNSLGGAGKGGLLIPLYNVRSVVGVGVIGVSGVGFQINGSDLRFGL
jgi:hypothetical protein